MDDSGTIRRILASGRSRIVGETYPLAENRAGTDDDVAARAHAGAEQSTFDPRVLAHVAAFPQDAVADACARLHAHARGQHGVGTHLGPRGDAAARADVERGAQVRSRLDHRALVHPPSGNSETLEAHGDASAEDVAVDLEVLLGGADVAPVAAGHVG